ncbi:MAG: SSS family solute:Na+ symporter [Planctomycetota bacterium]|jgi:SSS family solute:Na+ symporter
MDYPVHTSFVAVYLLVLIGVGAMKAAKIKTQEDFSLAGRGLGFTVLVGTLLATWIGTGSIFGNAQKTYQIGMSAFLIPISGAAGIVALYYLAQRIRNFGQFTIQDILEARFGLLARVLATVALLGAYVIIVSYQYRSGAAVLERLMPDLSSTMAIIYVAIFVILYTALAGMFSVAYTDVANGIMMIIGVSCAIPILLNATGGWSAAVAAVETHGLSGADAATDATSVTSYWDAVKLLGILLPAFLLMLGDANMYQRFFSAKDAGTAKRSAIGMFVGVLFLECAIIMVAFLASALVSQGKLSAPENSGHIIIHAAFNVMPTFLGAMLVATAVAIVVSTADSYLLAPATSVVRDIYQRFINPNAADMKIVHMSRICVLVLGVIALGLAFTSDEFFGVALFSYTIYGCAITPAMLAAFFWKRATGAGASASIITGGGVAVLWECSKTFAADGVGWATWMVDTFGIGSYEHVLAALPLSVIALVGVSLIGKPPTAEQANAI